MKKNIRKLSESFLHAFRGLRLCICEERNFRVHMTAAFYVILFAVFGGVSMTEAAILRRILRPPGRRPMIRHAGRFGQGSAVADPSPRNSRVRNSARRRVTGSGSAGP